MRRGQGRSVVRHGDPVALIHHARSGDRDAFLELFDQFAHAELTEIEALVPGAPDPEDLLLEVFEAVLLEDPPDFDAEFSVGDWLCELAYVVAA